MFVSITRNERSESGAHFTILDSCFAEDLFVEAPRGIISFDKSLLEPIAIARVYDKRKLNRARALAIYYYSQELGLDTIDSDFRYFDNFPPEPALPRWLEKSVKKYCIFFQNIISHVTFKGLKHNSNDNF